MSNSSSLPVWVLITGLVRDREVLVEKVNTLEKWRGAGAIEGIVFSTWIGELDRYPGLKGELRSRGVVLVESAEPALVSNGHVFHQNKALWLGLDAIPATAFVYKLRADLGGLTEEIREGITQHDDLAPSPLPGWPRIFERRVLAHSGLLTHPMFLNDTIFGGGVEDLRKLAAFFYGYKTLDLSLNAEQMIHGAPFLTIFPALFQFFRVNPGLIHFDGSLAEDVLRVCLEEPFFVETLVLYYFIVAGYYRIGIRRRSSVSDAQFFKDCKSLTYADVFSRRDDTLPGLEFHAGANAITFFDERWMRAILENRLSMDPLGERFAEAVARVKSPEYLTRYRPSALALTPEGGAFARRLNEQFPTLSLRLSDIEADVYGGWRVAGRRGE